MRPIKLLIADVDGTLVTQDKVLTARACEAVDRLRAVAGEIILDSEEFQRFVKDTNATTVVPQAK